MNRFVLPVLAIGAAATGANAAEVQIAAQGPVVELNVVEQVDADPDLVTVSAGVTTDAATAVEAMRQNSAEMRRVVDRIKTLGIAERDIQTTGINLGARYDYDQGTQRQVFRGYQASNRVSVKLRDIDKTGEVLDALVVAGATDLGGPSFSLENDAAAKAEARKRAMENARNQAMEYARMAGYADIRLLEINESISGYGGPMPMVKTARMEMASDASAPVQPGQVTTVVNVTVKYELTR